MAHFTFPVTTATQQTIATTNATVSGTSVVTGVTLSGASSLPGVYSGTLTLPAVGSRVLVVLLNDSLDEGVIVGAL